MNPGPNTQAQPHTPAPDNPAPPTAALAPDCKHYLGDRPCVHNRLCRGCQHYEPYSHRICVIKLGALGDVIRTLCILPELRDRYPNAHVTWVSKPNGCRMIGDHPMIDRVLVFDAINAMTLAHQAFDTVINLDKEPEPCALAMSLNATHKLGIGLSPSGTPVPLNPEAGHYFNLGLSDDLKFRSNTKSYPQLVHEALGWTYHGQRYELPVDTTTRDRVWFHLASRGWCADRPTLGINVGAGHVFANKMWPAPRITELMLTLRDRMPDLQVVLLGGPDERPIINAVTARLRTLGCTEHVIDGGTDHDERTFVALVDACDALFTGDTMAMHVAIARGKAIVAFFGPTCEQEIDFFGKGHKLVARTACSPCYKRHCDQNDACIDQIDTRDAADAVERLLTRVKPNRHARTAVPLPLAG